MAGIQGRGLKRVLTAIVAVAVLGGVAAGRIVGFGRLQRGTSRVGKLVPGLGILIAPSGVV